MNVVHDVVVHIGDGASTQEPQMTWCKEMEKGIATDKVVRGRIVMVFATDPRKRCYWDRGGGWLAGAKIEVDGDEVEKGIWSL